ncbi:TonB-dependent receptor domain-containing protein [Pseudomonas sp. CGJS7]|uniref:TonB-dependent receptor domain-containing protein n=1 Tax=Pseudomonas sp. CGJS7 TaxID=3109348 RepID=UPI00300BD95E
MHPTPSPRPATAITPTSLGLAWGAPAQLLMSLGLACGAPAQAQEDPTQSAGDAFGQRIGQESIGLYSESLVRGFNLQEAGNYRLNDAYFVRAANPSDAVIEAVQVRVGPSALNLSFPAPSGSVHYRLIPGDRDRAKLELGFQHLTDGNPRPYLRAYAAKRSQDGRASLAAGFIGTHSARYIFGNQAEYYGLGLVPRLRVGERWQLTGLLTRYDHHYQADVGFTPSGMHALPRPDRLRYLGQPWSRYDTRNTTYGAILASEERDNAWDYRWSSLYSGVDRPRSDLNLFEQVAADGQAHAAIVIARGRKIDAWGHEAIARRDWSGDGQRSELTLMARLRRSDYRNPRVQYLDLGPASILKGAPPLGDPGAATPGPHSSARVDQRELGLGWQWQRRDGVTLNLGARRAAIDQSARPLQGPAQSRASTAWLYNASLVVPLSERATAFAATTRGIEEGVTAPENASNRYQVLEPVLARQNELGIKWQTRKDLALLAMAFEIEKPSPGFDDAALYRYLTEVSHRGVEVSLAGQLSERLSIVAGLTQLRLRQRGELVERGAIGARPLGRSPRQALLSVDYRVARLPGLSLDADLNYYGPRPADALNRFDTPGYALLNLGARYRFERAGVPAALRLRVYNAGNRYGWSAGSSGIQTYEPERRVMLSLSLGR